MCEPISATIAAVGVASTLFSAYSSYNGQQAANKASEYNAAMMDRSATIANQQAEVAVQRGAIEEKQYRLRVADMKGRQRAGFSGSGLLVDAGTPLDVTKDTSGFGELDALTIRNNAAMESWNIKNNASNYTAQANLSRFSKGSPSLAMTGSLLSGASSLATSLYGMRGMGGGSSIPIAGTTPYYTSSFPRAGAV